MMGNLWSSPAQPLSMRLNMKVGRWAEASLPRLAEHLAGHDALAHDDAYAPRTDVDVPVIGEAISSNQFQSDTSSRNLSQSVAISSNQFQSVPISRNQSQSVPISPNQSQSVAISGSHSTVVVPSSSSNVSEL